MNGNLYIIYNFPDRDIKSYTRKNSVAPQNSSKIKLQIFQHSLKDLEHGNAQQQQQ